jgi:hypothetical protein
MHNETSTPVMFVLWKCGDPFTSIQCGFFGLAELASVAVGNKDIGPFIVRPIRKC